MKRRRFLFWTVAALFLIALSPLAAAQDFPSKPIKFIVPYPGGVPDYVARILGQLMSGPLGQPIVVESVPGASGQIAVQKLIHSAPDGYSLVFADAAQWAIVPAMRPGVYDPVKDMLPVGLAVTSTLYIAVTDTFPAKSLQELIAIAKAKPGTLSYASSGVGSLHHLFMESFKAAMGIDILHVPYKGTSQAMVGFLGGEIPIAVGGLLTLQGQAKEGKVRLLSTATKERSRLTPDVPSMSDAGAPQVDFPAEMGFFVPARTPKSVIDKLTAALASAVNNPDFVAKIGARGLEATYGTPEQLGEIVRKEGPKYVRALELSGFKPQ